MNWEKLFEPHILQRGYAYYREGAVTEISVTDNAIEATVEGSENYSVEISLKNGKAEDMACTCPYAEDGNYCKHMAAVLYAYENNFKENHSQTNASQPMTYEQLRTEVNKADSALVRRFMTDILWCTEKYRLQFLAMIHPERTEDLITSAKHRLDEIVEDAEGYDGYIDYYAASRFIAEISEWMDDEIDPLLEKQQDRDAFDLTIYVMETLDSVEMDDSDGGITEIAGRCYDIWQAILDHGDPKMEQEMFDFFLNNIDGQIVDYLEEYYESILMARFEKPEYLEKKLSLYQTYLNAVDPASTDWSVRDHTKHYIQQIQTLMIQLNKPSEELDAFNQKYWAYPFIRKAYMEECKKKEQWDKLIDVLRESIVLDEKDSPGYVRDYHLMLKDAYLKTGQKEAYLKELRQLATRIMPGNVDIFIECKHAIPAEQWPAKREELFAAVKEKQLLNRLYSEEKLYDRLLKNVLSSPGLYTLQGYETELLPLYPQKVLEKYIQEINREAKTAASRDAYQSWVKILRHMRKLPGGREAVQQIVNEWRTLYRRRKAMMEELDKLS